ncbi:HEAT repeat domain-containing protein [Candidatus Margulisiibacteriota bacterium]
MEINLQLVIGANIFLFVLIVLVILFIILRRMIFLPYKLIFNSRIKYYQLRVEEFILSKGRDKDVYKKTGIPKNNISRLALEKVLQENRAATDNIDNQKILTGIFEDSGLIQWRIKQLESRSVWKRRYAVDALGKSYSSQATIPLIIALRDTDEDVRFLAAKCLGKVNATGAIEFIITMIKDLPEDKCLIIADTLINYGLSAVDPIIKSISNDDEKTRYWLIRALAEIDFNLDGDACLALEENLFALLKDDSDRVRASSVFCLSKICSPDKVNYIAKLLEDVSPLVRAEAARALGKIDDPRTIDILINALGDNLWTVNYAASRALLGYGNIIKQRIKDNLYHPKNIVRKRCRELLEELKINDMG